MSTNDEAQSDTLTYSFYYNIEIFKKFSNMELSSDLNETVLEG